MLDDAIRTQLTQVFGRLTAPVELVATLDDSPLSGQIRALIADLVGLSPLLSTREGGGEGLRRPSFSVGPAGQPGRVRFAAVPMGHEFTSLILAILQAGGVAPKVEPATAQAVRALPPMRLETWVSLSCHNCPEVVQALDAMAALNPGIEHVMVDGAHFQAELEARGIMGVPAVFLDGRLLWSGRGSLEEILAKLDTEAPSRAAAELGERPPYDVLVVGGGPAGATAAIYAARKGIRVGLVAERFGGQVGDTLGIENLISVPYTEGPKLVAAMEQNVLDNGVEVLRQRRAEAFRPADADGLHEVGLAGGATLRARAVVLAPGARWRELKVPGEAEYRTKGVAFCPHCDGPLFKGKRVAVVGGGNSGVEAAIDLAGVVAHVTLLEFAPELRADAVLQARLRSLPNVEILVNAQTTEILGDGQRVTGLRWTDRASGASALLEVAGVFVQIGLLPNTDWLRGSLALSRFGEIEVDTRGQTSVPGVFAAGDATTAPFKQIVISMGEGAKASLAAFEHLIRQAPLSPASS